MEEVPRIALSSTGNFRPRTVRPPCGFGPRVCGGSLPADEPGLLPRLSIVEDLSQGEMAGSSDVGAAAAVAIETVRRSSGTTTGR